MSGEITRFAPSPTGELHLGHALAAQVAWDGSRRGGGTFLLRLEDIDTTRCRENYVAMLEEDLRWLGFTWPEPVWRQSRRMEFYAAALERLRGMGLLYPCFCTRQEIAAAASAPQGPEGPVYPGTCRHLPEEERTVRILAGSSYAWRLDGERAMRKAGVLTWRDRRQGTFTVDLAGLGDVVLARKEVPASYHLAVTVDDAAQGVTLVTRGGDLLAATHVHRLLQALLDLPVPEWLHHRLICDGNGRRLAKRDAARSLRHLRDSAGWSPADVRRAVAG
ncbi:MAG: tRNA glutamyl-Q(34) synthetase GluQRS [Verrucomicrobiota bacterium]